MSALFYCENGVWMQMQSGGKRKESLAWNLRPFVSHPCQIRRAFV